MKPSIIDFDKKKDDVLKIFKFKNGNISEKILIRILGPLFILAELRVILKYLVDNNEIDVVNINGITPLYTRK